MTDTAALAAIIRDGTETEIGIAYALLIAEAGHDGADEIWDDAHRQVDNDLGPGCPRCPDRHALEDCPTHDQADQ